MAYRSVTCLIQSWLLSCAVKCSYLSLDFSHHSYGDIADYLHDLAAHYQNTTHLYSIGKSVQGRELWVLAIGEHPHEHELLKPELKYVGNMHGNEVVSKEILLHFIDHLTHAQGDESDGDVARLLRESRVHILPTMNPDRTSDGIEGGCRGSKGRYNSNRYDLNRNFPDEHNPRPPRLQPETAAVVDWIHRHQFLLSGSLHGGALVASYPYDSYLPAGNGSTSSVSKDEAEYHHLATLYAQTHTTMHKGEKCPDTRHQLDNGTTNGADWYPIKGGMGDYNYMHAGCMELTLEVACCKYPFASRLPEYWAQNKDALLQFLLEGLKGVKGVVADSGTDIPIVGASVEIVGRDHPTNTTKQGEYWRYLLPGQYQMHVEAIGYNSQTENFTVSDGDATILNITLIDDDDRQQERKRSITEHISTAVGFVAEKLYCATFFDPANCPS